MRKHLFAIATLFFLLAAANAFAAIYQLTLMLDKPAYGPGDRIEVYGTLLSGSTPLNSTNVTLTIGSSAYTLATSSDGAFYSRSGYYPAATLISAPSTAGNYDVTASYSGVNTSVSITVIPLTVDNIVLDMDRGSYYAGQVITLVIKTKSGDRPVTSASVNGSIKDSADAAVSGSSFSCTTDTNGACNVTLTAPSTSGKYAIQTNDGLGYTVFWVNPFDVSILIKDSTTTATTYVFKRGDTGYVNAVVTYNSTTPTGTYTASGSIVDTNGSIIASLSSATLNQNNSYSTNMPFTLGNAFTTGSYKAVIDVAKTGGGTVSKNSSYFEVRDWTLTVEKTGTGSGFEYGYTAFANTSVFFEAFPVDKSTSNTITGLENSFNISLNNNFGVEVANSTAAYNSQCSCYKFNFTTPSATGSYMLSVSAYYNETQTVMKPIIVTDTTASALTTDVSGSRRLAFASEYIYIKPTLANSSNSSFRPSDAEVVVVTYENGTTYSYTNVSNWSVVNLSNSVYEWSWNDTSKMIKMDAPDAGGFYRVEIYCNNRSYPAVTQFIKKPYFLRVSFKNSEDTSVTNDYWWQFKTSDTIYAHIAIVEADVNGLQNLTYAGGNGSAGGMWGVGNAPTINTNKEKAVTNATITMKVYHAETGKEEMLNTTTSTCKATNTDGKYICKMQQNESLWTGGGHRVVFMVNSADGRTQDRGDGFFEARSFYIYGWPQNWRNKPNSTVTLNINAYVAGTGWWSSRSSGGVTGTVALEKIEYMGSGSYWLRSPVKYDYNTTGVNATALNSGQGTLSLSASKVPGSQWKSGSYTAVVKVTETSSGTVDYGRVWFEIRNWDVWSQPIEIASGNIQYKWEFNNYENVSLYVIINNAGEWGQTGQSLGGNVTISVKSIMNYIKWPPREMNTSEYISTNITVNQSNSYFWGSAISGDAYGKYILNISPADGTWDSGYYSMDLDVNGTEGGYGWFSAIAFYVNTQSVNENYTNAYAIKGSKPMYFNVTTTKNSRWGSSYSASDYVNTTIKEVTLRRWDETTYQQIEYKYPTDINVSVVGSNALTINGTGTLNITLASGSWPSGYYNGEIVLENVNGSKGNGWLWVEVRPFRIHFGTANQWSNPSIGINENLTGNLSIYEPSWDSWNMLAANYTIDSIYQEEWGMSGRHIINMTNYTPSNTQIFNGSTAINVSPDAGGWTGSYTWKNLRPTVRNANTSDTQTGYIGFRAIPALLTISTTSSYGIATSDNVTINITVTNPGNTSLGSALNLTSIEEWVWNPSNYMSSYNSYNFTVGSCNSAAAGSGGCLVNSTLANGSAWPVTVTITPPSGGWSEGYHYPYAYFSRTDVATSYYQWDICNWNAGSCNINFQATEPIRGYMYAVNWRNAPTNNVTMYMYSLTYVNGSTATVNVASVKYAKQSGDCWSDSCRIYSNANFVVTDYSGTPTGSDQIAGSGYITIVKPSGNWETGEYNTKVTVQAGGYSATIKDGNFRIADMTPPTLLINSPLMNQTFNASTTGSFQVSATTNKNSRCSAEIRNYDSYYSIYCGSGNVTNSTACSNVSYNGSTSYYKYITAWCYSGAECMSTGGTTHAYTKSLSDMSSQNYTITFWCWDDDWNSASNATVFGVVGSTANASIIISNVTLTYPPNGTMINTSTVNFTWQAAGNASNYTFQLANSSSFADLAMVNSTNTTSTNITIHNIVNGTGTSMIYYWKVRGFNGTATGGWSDVSQFTNRTA